MTEMPSPGVWLVARALTHVGKYRWLYGIFAVWLAVIVIVPVAERGSPDAPAASADAPPATTTPVEPPAQDTAGDAEARSAPRVEPLPPSPPPAAPSTAPSRPVSPAVPPDRAPVAGSAGDDEPAPPEDGTDLLSIPPPPPLPLPPTPEALAPVLRVWSPLVHTACSPVGLAGVVLSVAGPAVEPVPAGQLAAYLTPLYVVCAQFPQYGPRTVCEADQIYATDVTGGLLPPPAIAGIAVDTIEQMERMLAELGLPVPGNAETLRDQLNCTRVRTPTL